MQIKRSGFDVSIPFEHNDKGATYMSYTHIYVYIYTSGSRYNHHRASSFPQSVKVRVFNVFSCDKAITLISIPFQWTTTSMNYALHSGFVVLCCGMKLYTYHSSLLPPGSGAAKRLHGVSESSNAEEYLQNIWFTKNYDTKSVYIFSEAYSSHWRVVLQCRHRQLDTLHQWNHKKVSNAESLFMSGRPQNIPIMAMIFPYEGY